MLTLFFDCHGPLRIEFLNDGASVNAERYVETLKSLKSDIRNKRRGGPQPGLLLHDNARPHTALRTKEATQKMKFDILSHPPYSPDLAPADFALFPRLKKLLRGRVFENRENLEREVRRTLLFDIQREEFASAIDHLFQRWQKCVKIRGDFVEKVHTTEEDAE